MYNGIINVNKPSNISSFQVVSVVRKLTNVKKVGHLGTLDPMACGVLPIAVGKATKLFDYFLNKRKGYRACFCFGIETDTFDSEGVVTSRCDTKINLEDVKSATKKFIGKISQVPPKFSAKSVNGVRAYEMARNNKEFELKPVNIDVYKFDAISQISENVFMFNIECGSGCYIRSLCRDLAKELNTVGYMPMLIRTDAGIFKIEDSIDFTTLKNSDNLEQFIIPIDKCLPFDSIQLNDDCTKKIKNGLVIYTDLVDGLYKLYDSKNSFFALGRADNNKLKMELFLSD